MDAVNFTTIVPGKCLGLPLGVELLQSGKVFFNRDAFVRTRGSDSYQQPFVPVVFSARG